jgi:hypothetical protein
MKQHKQRGVAHILLIAILVLVALSGLARCDIEHARGDEFTPLWEHSDAMETNPSRVDVCLIRPAALQRGL